MIINGYSYFTAEPLHKIAEHCTAIVIEVRCVPRDSYPYQQYVGITIKTMCSGSSYITGILLG